METLDPNDLVVLDESGANLAMVREYGRSDSGKRICLPKPFHRGSKYSIISAISPKKIVASLYCNGSIDGDLFSGFIEHCLAPELTPRHKVMMDNVAFHKVKKAEELIKETGAMILYLPPYSPDLSPIEMMYSKIKSILRKCAARTAETFQDAISAAFYAIKEKELVNWFAACGYRIKHL